MSIIIKDLTYIHPDKETLFEHLNLVINEGEKIALTGNNGCGKSTLMQIISQKLSPTSGSIISSELGMMYYIPQHFGQYDTLSLAQALGINSKIEALHSILNGDASESNFSTLDNDWNIEERVHAALKTWSLDHLSMTCLLKQLSGGEKTRLFLAGMELHHPSIILMDEPTNHLDTAGRNQFYNYVQHSTATLLIISHDRALLNLLPTVCELSHTGIIRYGGNYDFYKEQKVAQLNALQQQLIEKQHSLKLTRQTAQEIEEQKAKQNVRGEKRNIKKGVPRIALNYLRNKAEQSTSKLNDIHAEKAIKLQQEIQIIKNTLPLSEKLKTNFNASELHPGKILVTAKNVLFHYPAIETNIWTEPLNFQLRSGDRYCIKGNNGSGKTSLLKLITGELSPTTGIMERSDFTYVYLDQEYSMIQNEPSIVEQAESFNRRHLPEHEIKMILNRYLFPKETWNKPCQQLSGGEKMRLSFCCLMIANNTPDIFILDEPTNNLDIESIEIITATIRDYTGTVLTVSHDKEFLKEINCEHELVSIE
ncbi:MAG: ATP-binding cassette domain-containing protein [Bacteroides sp.]|jgi:ATPase subunit of ABC transporter with duplicated ATPase domains|nr:ATP-binding cassette domain-containing protein [Bacteroides sp.]MCI1682008.1 ATP-binding cassette domain-containing protein [Bacteroides sp.]